MLLRASSQYHGVEVDVSVVKGWVREGGVAQGELLGGFAEALISGSDDELAHARSRVLVDLGPAALVDAAGVAALFNAIDRVADATGIPVEEDKLAASADFRERLQIGKYREPG